MHRHRSILNRQRDTFCHAQKKHSSCKNTSSGRWTRRRKERKERKEKRKTRVSPKEDSLENKQARQRISPPRSANDLFASLVVDGGLEIQDSPAWQETNRRWDGPIANSFRVERTPCSLLPPPIHWTPSPPPLSATSVVFSLLFFFVSLFFSLPLLVRSPFPLLHPTVGWCCVGIQRPHNRLLAHSVSWNSPSPPWSPSFFLFHLFLIQPGQPCLLLLFLLFVFVLPACSVSYWQRYAAIPLFHARETRAKRQGSVKEEARAMARGMGLERGRITRGIGKAGGRQRGRHNDWPFLRRGLNISAAPWRGMNW